VFRAARDDSREAIAVASTDDAKNGSPNPEIMRLDANQISRCRVQEHKGAPERRDPAATSSAPQSSYCSATETCEIDFAARVA